MLSAAKEHNWPHATPIFLAGSAVLGMALAFFACSTIQQLSFQQPSVELDAVEVTGLGLSGGSLVLLLDVHNPNGYELRTTRVEAELDLENTHFGDAALADPVVLPPSSSTSVEVPVTFTWSGVGAGARAILGRGAVAYALDTRILADTPLGERSVALHTSGEVPIAELVR